LIEHIDQIVVDHGKIRELGGDQAVGFALVLNRGIVVT
jgi:hypothetical protein